MNHQGLKIEVGQTPHAAPDSFPAPSRCVDTLIPQSESVCELRHIVIAFVDLGFGSSAAQLAARPANDNRGMNSVIEDFYSKAA